jgi:CRP-like cAMP-binding protein
MGLVHDPEVWRQRLAALPLASYDAGETVFAEGTKTGRLLILKSGAVAIVKGGTEIATVAEPGAVFGELSALLDSRTAPTCARWKRPTFTSPTPPRCWGRIRPRFFT